MGTMSFLAQNPTLIYIHRCPALSSGVMQEYNAANNNSLLGAMWQLWSLFFCFCFWWYTHGFYFIRCFCVWCHAANFSLNSYFTHSAQHGSLFQNKTMLNWCKMPKLFQYYFVVLTSSHYSSFFIYSALRHAVMSGKLHQCLICCNSEVTCTQSWVIERALILVARLKHLSKTVNLIYGLTLTQAFMSMFRH